MNTYAYAYKKPSITHHNKHFAGKNDTWNVYAMNRIKTWLVLPRFVWFQYWAWLQCSSFRTWYPPGVRSSLKLLCMQSGSCKTAWSDSKCILMQFGQFTPRCPSQRKLASLFLKMLKSFFVDLREIYIQKLLKKIKIETEIKRTEQYGGKRARGQLEGAA